MQVHPNEGVDIEAATNALAAAPAHTAARGPSPRRSAALQRDDPVPPEPGARVIDDYARLLGHCGNMLQDARKMQWVVRRVEGYLSCCELTLMLVLAVIAAVLAMSHSLMTVENFKHSHAVMGGLAGVQTMIVGLTAHLKLGHRVSELKVTGGAFDVVLADLQVAASGTLTKAELKDHVRACEKALKAALSLCTHSPPKWALDEANAFFSGTP